MMNPTYSDSVTEILESLNHVIFTLDNQGIITYVSSGCSAILGFLPEEMINKPISAFVIPGDKGSIGEMHGQADQEEIHPARFHVAGKNGGLYQTTAIPWSVFDGQGKSGMICLIGETRAGKQTEEIIRQANIKINLMNSTIRHDINNQLTVLNGYLSLMEENDGTIPSSQIVTILLEAAGKIQKMITFTKEYKDLGSQVPKWINLYDTFQSARSLIDPMGVQITIDPTCQELELFCDPQLSTVFYQLIDNSLRHGTTVSEVSLQWRPGDKGAIIVYRDNGTGIPQTIRPVLFQPIKGKKIGYGLYLVRELLAIPGFTITETGTPGNGVQFEVVVPAGSFRTAVKKQL